MFSFHFQACKNNRFQIQQNTIDAIQAVLKRFADVHNILQIIEGKTLQTLKSVSQNMLRNEQSIVDNANKLNQKLSVISYFFIYSILETFYSLNGDLTFADERCLNSFFDPRNGNGDRKTAEKCV